MTEKAPSHLLLTTRQLITWIKSPEGIEVLHLVSNEPDALKASTRIRKQFPNLSIEAVTFAISQAKLRRTAQVRWGTSVDQYLFSDDGLSQATRPQVADYRARRMRESGFLHGIDLTCGLGFDLLGFIRSGIRMVGVERDQVIAEFAQFNCPDAMIHIGDALSFEIPEECDFVFIDPARRDIDGPSNSDGTAKRQFNPERWSPPWSFIELIAATHTVLVKAAPGMDVSDLTEWDVEWISIDGSLVEANLFSEGTGQRTATLLSKDSSEPRHFERAPDTPVQTNGKYLVVPDSAIIRAGALKHMCTSVNGGLVNEHIAWILSDDQQRVLEELERIPRAIDALEILTETRIDDREIRDALKTHGASSITIMTRGIDTDVEGLRKRLLKATSKGHGEIVIALCRDEPQARAFICRRLPQSR